jgi:PAS domain-containing protein
MDPASNEETPELNEDALRESEARFRELADSARVLLWRAGTDALCDFFNRPWLEFRGRAMKEVVSNGWFNDGVHPEDKEFCWNTYVGAFEARQEFREGWRLGTAGVTLSARLQRVETPKP